jgi:hypothetical protein
MRIMSQNKKMPKYLKTVPAAPMIEPPRGYFSLKALHFAFNGVVRGAVSFRIGAKMGSNRAFHLVRTQPNPPPIFEIMAFVFSIKIITYCFVACCFAHCIRPLYLKRTSLPSSSYLRDAKITNCYDMKCTEVINTVSEEAFLFRLRQIPLLGSSIASVL